MSNKEVAGEPGPIEIKTLPPADDLFGKLVHAGVDGELCEFCHQDPYLKTVPAADGRVLRICRKCLNKRLSGGITIRTSADGPKRNDLCPCGSGEKYKRCCLRGGANA